MVELDGVRGGRGLAGQRAKAWNLLAASQPASQSVTTTGLRGVDMRQELRGTCGRVAAAQPAASRRRRCGRRQRQGKRGLGFPIPSAMYFSGFCKVHTILEFTMYVQYTPSCEQNLQPPEIYKWCLPCGPRRGSIGESKLRPDAELGAPPATRTRRPWTPSAARAVVRAPGDDLTLER